VPFLFASSPLALAGAHEVAGGVVGDQVERDAALL